MDPHISLQLRSKNYTAHIIHLLTLPPFETTQVSNLFTINSFRLTKINDKGKEAQKNGPLSLVPRVQDQSLPS